MARAVDHDRLDLGRQPDREVGHDVILAGDDDERGMACLGRELGRHLGVLNVAFRWWAAVFASIFLVAGVIGPAWWVLNAIRAA